MKIPGLYDGTDKTFFMYNWEQIRSEVPFPQVYTVPSALERAGDFSQSRTADGRPITIYDPLTTRLENGQYVRDPFPGNVIPANRIDPVALAMLQRVPLPNAAGLVNNLLVPENARADRYDQHVVKVDQVINANHRFFVRFARNKRTEMNDYAAFPPEASPWYQHGRMNVGFAGERHVRAQPVARAQLARRLHPPRFLHRARTATTSIRHSSASRRASPRSCERQTFPQIQWDGYTHVRQHVRRQQRQHLHRQRHVVVVRSAQQDQPATTRSSSAASCRAMVNDQQNPTSSFGPLHLQPRVHAGATRWRRCRRSGQLGRVAAARLSGRRSTTTNPSVSPIFPQLHYRGNYFGLFVQDDWRVNSRLTLNAGLRWDYESPVVEDLNQQNIGFDTTSPNPFQVPGLPLTGGLLFASDDQRMPFKKDLNNIQPRAGATFRIDDQTVLRGGYALAYLPTFDNGYNNGFSVTTTLVASTDGGITPTGRLSNPFPAGLDQPVGSSQGLATLVGRGFTFSDPERTIPYVHQFSVGVQRELPGRLALDMSVRRQPHARPARVEGDQRDHRRTARDRRLHAPAGPESVPGPAAGHALQRRHGAAAAARASVPAVRLASPRIAGRFGVNDYDALQISVNKRMSSGLQFLVSYTYSRTEEEVTYLNPQDDWDQLTRVVTAADSPHRLLVSSTYAAAVLQGPGGRDGEPARWLADERHRHVPVRAAGGDDGGRVPRRRSDASRTRRSRAGSTPARRR